MARTVPHFKLHASIQNHRKTAMLFADNDLLAIYVRIGILLIERFADRTDDFAIVSGGDLITLTGCQQVSGAVQRMKRVAACSPVVFLEPKRIYRMVRQDVQDDGTALPLDVCFLLRPGDDVTLISWGAMIHEVSAAADRLAERGVSVEIIDVATLKPLDTATILQSVEKTGRCVIVHEAALSGGWGAEIAARVAEYGLMSLLAPVKRVTGYDTVMPLFRLEEHYMPSVDRIVKAVDEVMAFS